MKRGGGTGDIMVVSQSVMHMNNLSHHDGNVYCRSLSMGGKAQEGKDCR